MEIIIHGKPLDASERCSKGVEQSFARKIIDEYFRGSGSIRESEALIVEARYWQGSWTSVYTLLLSQQVKDRAGRGSYFAISLLLPRMYHCLVSDIYYLLEKLVRENVIGTYLDKNLQYQVQNFEDNTAFDRLYQNLQSSYSPCEKAFDNGFKPQASLLNDTYCSIYDCDALSFVNLLKVKGRIIVTEQAVSKDKLAAQSAKYHQEALQAQSEVQAKTKVINDLNARISRLEEQAQQASSSVGGKMKELEKRLASLQNEKTDAEKKAQEMQASLAELRNNVAKAASLLGVNLQQGGITQRTDYPSFNTQKPTRSTFMEYLPAVNTILILLLTLGVFIKSCGNTAAHNEQEALDAALKEAAEAKTQVESLSEQMKLKDEEIISLRQANESLQSTIDQSRKNMEDAMRQMQERSRKLNSQNKPPQPPSPVHKQTAEDAPKVQNAVQTATEEPKKSK